jgi:hypothetical protein
VVFSVRLCTIWVLDCCPNPFLWWGLLLPISDSCKSSLICLEHSRTTWSASAYRGILSCLVVVGFAVANFRILQVLNIWLLQIACLVILVFCFASVSSFPYCESCIAKPFFLLAAFYIQI